MNELRFEWDPSKAAFNSRKHGVSFVEARTVFYDDQALFMRDHAHSQHEERFVLLGLSDRLRALLVCHCYRQSDGVIRIISARKANRAEQLQYEQRRQP